MLVKVILYTLFVGVIGTGAGGVVGALFKKDSNKLTSILLSLAGGIMLSVVCFDLIPEAINNSNVYLVVVITIVSIMAIYLLNLFLDKQSAKKNSHIDKNHPKTHDDLDELIHSDVYSEYKKDNQSNSKLLQAGIMMVIAIALHNFPEGLSIGSAYATDNGTNTGFVLAVLIALHNIPEGMAIVVPLIIGGMNRGKAILMTALSGLPTVLGAMAGLGIGNISSLGLSISLALASGAMAYIVFGEIFPQSILMCKSKAPAFAAILGLLLGLIIIYII